MAKRKVVFIPLSLCLIGATFIKAEGSSARELGLSGVHEAMGGAGVAGAMDSSALLLNPAGITQRRLYTLLGLYSADPKQIGIGASAIDSSNSPLGLGVLYYNQRGEGLQEHFLRVGLAEYYRDTLHIGMSYRHHWFWDPGFGEYRDFPAFGMGIILPLRYFSLGVAGLELLPRRDPYLDPRILLGIAVPFTPWDFFELLFLLDGVYHPIQKLRELKGGVEIGVFRHFSLRGGYRTDIPPAFISLHLGAGVLLPPLRVDYALTRLPLKAYRHTFTLEITLF